MTPLLEPRAVQTESRLGPQAHPDRVGHRASRSPRIDARLLAAGRNNRSNQKQGQAEGRQHFRQAPKAKPAQPSRRVKRYKLDEELTRRKRVGPARDEHA